MKEVGRNDPCPCGSGKKFKKCCGQKTPIQRRTFTQIDSDKVQSTVSRVTGLLSPNIRSVQPDKEEKKLNDRINRNPPPKTES